MPQLENCFRAVILGASAVDGAAVSGAEQLPFPGDDQQSKRAFSGIALAPYTLRLNAGNENAGENQQCDSTEIFIAIGIEHQLDAAIALAVVSHFGACHFVRLGSKFISK